jgi:hypothetical protein
MKLPNLLTHAPEAEVIYLGIFDGHNGRGCAEYARDQLHKNILAQVGSGIKKAGLKRYAHQQNERTYIQMRLFGANRFQENLADKMDRWVIGDRSLQEEVKAKLKKEEKNKEAANKEANKDPNHPNYSNKEATENKNAKFAKSLTLDKLLADKTLQELYTRKYGDDVSSAEGGSGVNVETQMVQSDESLGSLELRKGIQGGFRVTDKNFMQLYKRNEDDGSGCCALSSAFYGPDPEDGGLYL